MKQISAEPPVLNTVESGQQEGSSPITLLSIQQTIKKLKKNKTPGITAIPINYYKAGGLPISNMLHEWYQTLEQYQIVPWNLKVDIKVPIPKFQPGAHRMTKQDLSNYMPIAFQNCMYETLDGCLKIKLEQHNEMNNIIYPNQGDFKKQEGTTEQLFVIQNLFQYNEQLYCAFLDLKKAYHAVWREALFEKLEKLYHVPHSTVNLLIATYKNAKSITWIENTISPLCNTYSGLQQ